MICMAEGGKKRELPDRTSNHSAGRIVYANIPEWQIYKMAFMTVLWQETEEHMERKIYITEEEQRKCRKVADAFAELEDADIVIVDAGRYGFVKLQFYTPPTGFENDYTFTDSRELFEDLWEEWLNLQLYYIAEGTPVLEEGYDCVFKSLPEEKQDELMGRKQAFAEAAGIEI